MNVAKYTGIEVFEELKAEWNELLRCSVVDNIFSTWEWQSTWWHAYSAGDLYVLVYRDDNDQLLGIAPWYIETSEARGRVIQGIGCVDVTDYLDIIVHRDYVEDVYSAFADYLAEHSDEFDLIDLCSLPEASPVHTRFVEILQSHGFSTDVKQQDVCPVVELPETWDDYLANLNKKQRHEIRRKMRRSDGAVEEIDWYVVDSSHDLDEEVEKFLTLMAASASEKALFLQNPEHLKFFKVMVPVMYEAGWLKLNFLTVNGAPVASYLNFNYGDRILVYNSGLNHVDYGHLSPGIVLLSHNISDAIEQGYKYFDFLRGDETYKYRMGGVDTSVYQLEARKN